MIGRGLILIGLSAGLLQAAPASACDVMPGYEVPTTLDMAVASEKIILGRVVGERGDGDGGATVIVEPTLLLKGRVLPREVALIHARLETLSEKAHRSARRELREPNPDGERSECARPVFAKGMQLVLFLKRYDGELRVFASPSARTREDVSGPKGLWVKAVREYAAISMLPERERRAALRARMTKLAAQPDPDSIAIAADMQIELSQRR